MPLGFLDKIERILRKALEAILVVLLSGIAIICFVEVVLRYGFGRSFGWYDEFAGYLLVWLTFLGAVLAQSDERHIGMESLGDMLGSRGRRRLGLVILGLLAVIHLLLLYFGAQLATRFLTERAITLPIPMGLIYSVIPISAALMLVLLSLQAAKLLRADTQA